MSSELPEIPNRTPARWFTTAGDPLESDVTGPGGGVALGGRMQITLDIEADVQEPKSQEA
jgi:hypothetical protein